MITQVVHPAIASCLHLCASALTCVRTTRHGETQQNTEEEAPLCCQVTNNTADGITMEARQERREVVLWLRPQTQAFGILLPARWHHTWMLMCKEKKKSDNVLLIVWSHGKKKNHCCRFADVHTSKQNNTSLAFTNTDGQKQEFYS